MAPSKYRLLIGGLIFGCAASCKTMQSSQTQNRGVTEPSYCSMKGALHWRAGGEFLWSKTNKRMSAACPSTRLMEIAGEVANGTGLNGVLVYLRVPDEAKIKEPDKRALTTEDFLYMEQERQCYSNGECVAIPIPPGMPQKVNEVVMQDYLKIAQANGVENLDTANLYSNDALAELEQKLNQKAKTFRHLEDTRQINIEEREGALIATKRSIAMRQGESIVITNTTNKAIRMFMEFSPTLKSVDDKSKTPMRGNVYPKKSVPAAEPKFRRCNDKNWENLIGENKSIVIAEQSSKIVRFPAHFELRKYPDYLDKELLRFRISLTHINWPRNDPKRMEVTVASFSHPYFAVTAEGGKFSFEGVPCYFYEIYATAEQSSCCYECAYGEKLLTEKGSNGYVDFTRTGANQGPVEFGFPDFTPESTKSYSDKVYYQCGEPPPPLDPKDREKSVWEIMGESGWAI